jgi:hypothetical protein
MERRAAMAELQWKVEVRCVNTLLGEIWVGEGGEHMMVSVPDRHLDPAEFTKFVEGLEAARRIAREVKFERTLPAGQVELPPLETTLGSVVEVEGRDDLYQATLLKSGELLMLNMPGRLLGPTEFDQFIAEMKAIQRRIQHRIGSLAK